MKKLDQLNGVPFVLNEKAEIAILQWKDLPNRFSGVEIVQFSVMPDHVHGIVSIRQTPSRAEQSPAPTLGDIVCAYKSLTTKLCNKLDSISGRRIWQRNYYERIIRTAEELSEIQKYIKENHENWKKNEHSLFESEYE